MPVRKIPLRYSSLSGIKQSNKNKRGISFESALEADFIDLLEFDNEVLHYEEQPFLIEYLDEDKNRKRTYTPDFLVNYNQGIKSAKDKKPLLCEIKYSVDLVKNANVLDMKFKAAYQFAKELDYEFRVITEKEIRNEYLINVKFLRNYLDEYNNIHWPKALHVLDLLKKFKSSTPEELYIASSSVEENRAIYLYVIWYLIANRFINCDLKQKITMKTKLWIE